MLRIAPAVPSAGRIFIFGRPLPPFLFSLMLAEPRLAGRAQASVIRHNLEGRRPPPACDFLFLRNLENPPLFQRLAQARRNRIDRLFAGIGMTSSSRSPFFSASAATSSSWRR